jgi:hypothetical protein
MITALERARRCLTAKGLHALGGPVLPPSSSGSSTADGELVISSTHPTFIAFYTDPARARGLEATVVQSARRVHGQVERHGAVTIVWTRAHASNLRGAVDACVFR